MKPTKTKLDDATAIARLAHLDDATAIARLAHLDSWVNYKTGVGGSGDKTSGYLLNRVRVDPTTAWEFYSTSGLAQKVVERPISELMRPGYNITIPDGQELSNTLISQLADLDFNGRLTDALIYSRICGGSVIYLHTADADLTKPMQPGTKVTQLHTFSAGREIFGNLSTTVSKSITEATASLDSKNFGLPTSYSIRLPYMQFENVHYTRFIRFSQPTSFTDLIKNWGFGYSIYDLLWEPIQNYEVMCQIARHLGEDYSQAVLTIPGLYQSMATHANLIEDGVIPNNAADPVTQRIKELDRRRHASRALILDGGQDGKPAETFERKPTPVQGFGDLYIAAKEHISLVSEIPQSQLFGTGSSGALNNGMENTEVFRALVLGIQTRFATPAIERMITILMGKNQSKSWAIKFNPASIPSSKEESETHKTQADADMVYFTMGINPADIFKSRFGGEAYSLNTTLDLASWYYNNTPASTPPDADVVPESPKDETVEPKE